MQLLNAIFKQDQTIVWSLVALLENARTTETTGTVLTEWQGLTAQSLLPHWLMSFQKGHGFFKFTCQIESYKTIKPWEYNPLLGSQSQAGARAYLRSHRLSHYQSSFTDYKCVTGVELLSWLETQSTVQMAAGSQGSIASPTYPHLHPHPRSAPT